MGRSYSVESIIYSAPQFDFSYTVKTAPGYRISTDGQLMALQDKTTKSWQNVGTFKEENISSLSFDHYFSGKELGWSNSSLSPEKLRQNNEKLWRLDVADSEVRVFYLLLLQKNGDVYLTYGYRSEASNPASDAESLIRWVFKLTTTDANDI